MPLPHINILIIDDDAQALEQSRRKIALYAADEGIYTAGNSVEVMRFLSCRPAELVFIDVEMPDTDGFAIADYIKKTQPKAKYVFLTGHAELGAKSYEYEPLDFLCKPLDAIRLKKTFERFESSRSAGRYANKQIAVESSGGFVLISPADIRYIARENRKVVIHCRQRDYIVKYSLDEMEIVFSEFSLFRVHQSYLVPLQSIVSVAQSDFGNTYFATLADGDRVPVSRWKYISLRERLIAEGVPFV